MVFDQYLSIQATFLKSENGIWKLSKKAIERLSSFLEISKFQPRKVQKILLFGFFGFKFEKFQNWIQVIDSIF